MFRRRASHTDPGWMRWVVLALVAGVAVLGREWLGDLPTSAGTVLVSDETEARVERLFENRVSGEMTSVTAIVDRLLPDDDDGSRHQRFIVRLESGHTLLVAHNIDLAARVPLDEGARVQIRGEYEWNEQGGVLHWTHHDPDGRRAGGWIEFDGARYR